MKRLLNFKNHHVLVLTLIMCVVFSNVLLAQVTGQEWTVNAVTVNAQASWSKRKPQTDVQTGTYPIPDGWVVKSIDVIIHERNKGSFSTYVIGAGSNIIIKQDLKNAYQSAIDLAISYGKHQVAAQLRQELNEMMSTYTQISSTSNVIVGRATAVAWGDILNQKGAHIRITVKATLVYFGESSSQLMVRLKEKYKLNVPQPHPNISIAPDEVELNPNMLPTPTLINGNITNPSFNIGKIDKD